MRTVTIVCSLSIVGGCRGTTQRRPAPPIGHEFRSAADSGANYLAYVLLRASDCASNLQFLTLFGEETVQPRVAPKKMLLIGTPGELTAVRAELRRSGITTPVELATARHRAAARHLGLLRTPSYIIIDADFVVRAAGHSPSTVDGFVSLRSILPLLGAGETRDELLNPGS